MAKKLSAAPSAAMNFLSPRGGYPFSEAPLTLVKVVAKFRQPKRMRIFSAYSVAFLLVIILLIGFALVYIQLSHAMNPQAGTEWIGTLRSFSNYGELLSTLSRGVGVPEGYFGAGSGLGVAFGGLPAILILLWWMYITLAQCCKARNRRYAHRASCLNAWCDASKGGCAVRIQSKKADTLPPSQRRLAGVVMFMLTITVLGGLVMVGAAANRAVRGGFDARSLVDEALRNATERALRARNSTDEMIAAGERALLDRNLIARGTEVVVLAGNTPMRGATNLMKVEVLDGK